MPTHINLYNKPWWLTKPKAELKSSKANLDSDRWSIEYCRS